MNLKGSRTEKNLKDAFAGESQANRRYLYFAQKADVEGFNDVSAVFRSTPEAPPDFASADREGSLEAPTRRPLAWRDAEFYDVEALERELERVYDICHGCRRCFSLCNAFPTLFDAVDASAGGEVAGIEKKV